MTIRPAEPWSAGPVPVELGSTTARTDYQVTVPVDTPRKFVTIEVSE